MAAAPSDVSPLRAVTETHECCWHCSVLSDYLRGVADAMHMRDWATEVGHDPPLGEEVATVQVAPGRRIMRLRVAVVFWDLAAEDRRHAVAHEVFHPMLTDLYENVRHGATEALGGQAYRMFLSQFDRDIERLVDKLALVVEESLPLPEW